MSLSGGGLKRRCLGLGFGWVSANNLSIFLVHVPSFVLLTFKKTVVYVYTWWTKMSKKRMNATTTEVCEMVSW
jgi:hypothetical protein